MKTYQEKYPEAEVHKIGYVKGAVVVLVGNGLDVPKIEYRIGTWGVYGSPQVVRGWTIHPDGAVRIVDPLGIATWLSLSGGLSALQQALYVACTYGTLMDAAKKERGIKFF